MQSARDAEPAALPRPRHGRDADERNPEKAKAYSKPMYARNYALEAMEKDAGNLPAYYDLGHFGLDNGNVWAIHCFVEDRRCAPARADLQG